MEQSRKNNPGLGITGILCFSEDLFIPVLEGGRDEVCELFNTIVRDQRHLIVRILIKRKSPSGDLAAVPWDRSTLPRSRQRSLVHPSRGEVGTMSNVQCIGIGPRIADNSILTK